VMKALPLLSMLMIAAAAGCDRVAARGRGPMPTLVGTWHAEFRLGWVAGSTRDASGTIELRSDPMHGTVCAEDEAESVVCESAVRGTHRVRFAPMLGHPLDTTALGAVLKDDGVMLLIGPCCDRGEISARGRFIGGRIRGTWSETSVGGGRSGTFELWR
jgi:hypothetical protein